MAELSVDAAIKMLNRIMDECTDFSADAYTALEMGVNALLNQRKKTLTAVRAFSNPDYDYYVLKKPFGPLPKGAVFYHDLDDNIYGSIAQGCLKLCYTPVGDVYNICGGTVILHYNFAKDEELFEKSTFPIGYLKPGNYNVTVFADGKAQFKYNCDTRNND